ncbi:MAG: acyl-ACP--UDP-N-acetylglucosamine O-acyltransferase [Candidatus Omnitrophica bacterium]|nr:acyl-ACP--UDP-N-acetylglucosamine O-acyltransferase [Candidatus Omnitrophota bacterium]
MNTIHSSAIVGKNVQLGEGNEIGPGCVIADGAVIGSKNKLWMSVYVGPGTTIGHENQIHPGAIIGHEPQDHAFDGSPSFTTIGDRNIIREYVTIHRGTKPGTTTSLGSDNFLMANAHIAHNCQVGNHTIFVNLASIAGYCEVQDEAVLSGMAVFHQFCRVGRLAMISGLSAINKDVPPYMVCGGRPGVIQGVNVVGLRRAGISAPIRGTIRQAYKFLYREGLSVPHAIEEIKKLPPSKELVVLVSFIEQSKRGICAGNSKEDHIEEGESLLPSRSK